jgi:hypothetical protein
MWVKVMARKKRKQKKQHTTPCFVFTLEMVTLAQKAMRLFEQSLGQVENSPSKVVFAAETMQQINRKLETMQTSVGLATLDYNEKIVLAAAIQLYTLDLFAVPLNASSQKELRQCQQIERFALEHLTPELERTMHD